MQAFQCRISTPGTPSRSSSFRILTPPTTGPRVATIRRPELELLIEHNEVAAAAAAAAEEAARIAAANRAAATEAARR